jgi:alpha-L-fucosidase
MRKNVVCLLLWSCIMLSNWQVLAQTRAVNPNRMDWWKEARFGMFIHWGLYAVPAGIWDGKEIPGIGEWIMLRGKIPVADYKQLVSKFNPVKYNADEWVRLAKEAGMKYIVITSKHHDGFAMYKSTDPFNIVDATPYKKDPIQALAQACKKYNIRLGLYYSQAQDWTHPGGATATEKWDPAQMGDMDQYIDQVAIPQVREILSQYHPDIIWFDTPRDMNKQRADRIAKELIPYPNLIMNNRLGGGYEGDLETPEQFIPATGIPDKNWESCMTMNGTWGFKQNDQNWKSTEVLIRNLIDIASKGGNYLLNVGPTAEGLIPQASIERLQQMGAWLKINGESIYGTTASPFAYLSWGRATTKQNKLYLHVFQPPADHLLKVPLKGRIQKAYLLASPNINLKVTANGNYQYIQLPDVVSDKISTVIVTEVNGEIKSSLSEPIPSQGKLATASSTVPEPNAKYQASFAFDNNTRTSWKAVATDTTGWLQIDLGAAYSVGAVSLSESAGLSSKFTIEYQDGENWKAVATGKSIGNAFFKSFNPVKARFWRLNMQQAKAGGFEIKEFQLFYDE